MPSNSQGDQGGVDPPSDSGAGTGARSPVAHLQKAGVERTAHYLRPGSMFWVLLVASALFLAIFLLMAQTVVAQRQARQAVGLQDEAMLSLNALMETMLDAETGQRGYLLTGNPAYLEPFDRAKQRLVPEVAALQRLSKSGDAREQRHIARTQQLIGSKIAELDQTLQLIKDGNKPAAIALVRTNAGQRDMTSLRQELDWLRADQQRQRQTAFAHAQNLGDLLLPLVALLGAGLVLLAIVALRGERERAAAAAEARQFAALRVANEETQLLARELNHRVKNLFSVVLSIIAISARKQAPIAEVLDDIRARIHALSLAHSSSQGVGLEESCQLHDVIANILRPYADGDATQVRLHGPDVTLPTRMITPMGLLIHELATNGSKYGALSTAGGAVLVDWQVVSADDDERSLELIWTETGGPPIGATTAGDATTVPPTSGFGSRLTAVAAQQMGGVLEREWPASGAVVKLRCPLPY